jgi:hypothetical protein
MRLRSLVLASVELLVHAAAFAVAAYAFAQIVRGGNLGNFIVWFAGAAVLHDLVLLPLYSLADRIAHRPRRPTTSRASHHINYIRVPTLISGLLLLVYFPLILGLSSHNYLAATGHHLRGYARNWLEITAVLFASSGLLYLIRSRTARQ